MGRVSSTPTRGADSQDVAGFHATGSGSYADVRAMIVRVLSLDESLALDRASFSRKENDLGQVDFDLSFSLVPLNNDPAAGRVPGH